MANSKRRIIGRAPWLLLVLASGGNCSTPGGADVPRGSDEAGKRGLPEMIRRTLKHGGAERFYEVHVPPQYREGTPTPVVLVWHGGGGFPEAVATQSHMNEVSDRHGFLVAYPAGSGVFKSRLLTFNAGSCCGYAQNKGIDDVGFAAALIDDLARAYSVDQKRVYSTGISNGAMMSYRLACELPERIAAIGPVSGVLGVEGKGAGRPVSVIHFHGTDDENSPYQGGKGRHSFSRVDFRPVSDVVRFWVERNGCPANARGKASRGDAEMTSWGPCKGGTDVVLWTLKGGGHAWPGGDWASKLEGRIVGPVNRDISASELMWEFFEKHPLP
jgi:polyhydroxybutyrate depolymerase